MGKEAREVVCKELDRVPRDLGYSSIVNSYYSYMYGSSSGEHRRCFCVSRKKILIKAWVVE